MDRVTLIKHCQLGDLESFEQLYKIYSKNAMGTAYLIAGHKGIAEDIVQEAFFQCYKEIKRLKEPKAFDVWFYKLLVRLAWKMSSKYKDTLLTEKRIYEDSCYDGIFNHEKNVVEDRLAVHEAVEKLSPTLKTVIVLYYFNDMTIKQISMVLGCFQGTVKSRLHNAKKFLEKELNEFVDEGTFNMMYKGKECRDSD